MFRFKHVLREAVRLAVVCAVAFAGEARADTIPVDLLLSNTDLAIYLKDFPSGLDENKIYFDAATSTSVQGHVGSQTGTPLVNFSSTSSLDAANGFANIKGALGDYHDLTVTVPGYLFGDLIFGIQPNDGVEQNKVDLTIKAYNGATLLGSLTLTESTSPDLKKSADQNFLVLFELAVAQGSGITSVVLSSISGIFETKQFEISDLLKIETCTGPSCGGGGGPGGKVPLPPAIWLFASALAGMGLIGARRRRRRTPPSF